MSFPATAPGPNLANARRVWVEVMDRRREWARQAGDGHFEGVPAWNRARWTGELEDALTVLDESMAGNNEVDPRKAALDLLAVTSALIDVMGDEHGR